MDLGVNHSSLLVRIRAQLLQKPFLLSQDVVASFPSMCIPSVFWYSFSSSGYLQSFIGTVISLLFIEPDDGDGRGQMSGRVCGSCCWRLIFVLFALDVLRPFLSQHHAQADGEDNLQQGANIIIYVRAPDRSKSSTGDEIEGFSIRSRRRNALCNAR